MPHGIWLNIWPRTAPNSQRRQRGSEQSLQLGDFYFDVPIHEARRPRLLSLLASISKVKFRGFAFTLLAMTWVLGPLAARQVEAAVDVGQMTKAGRTSKGADTLTQPSIPQLDPCASLCRGNQIGNVRA